MAADAGKRRALLSYPGGGSGHEPMHGGFVGHGMLDGACPGAIFTSPTPDQIVACAQEAYGGAGVLLIVKNYTGDVLSFETAAELLHMEGIPIRTVLVDDDVAVKDSSTRPAAAMAPPPSWKRSPAQPMRPAARLTSWPGWRAVSIPTAARWGWRFRRVRCLP